MASTALVNGSRSIVSNGISLPNGEPPASTLAAQLVDNLTRATQQSRHQDREDFEQLLRIFESDSQDERHVDDPETREESIKLIDVVVKAGLESLSRDDPFEDRRVVVRQAIRSLAVIDATLRRNSALLFAPMTQDESQKRLHCPLYAWLVPRLWTSVLQETDAEFMFAVSLSLTKILMLGKKRRSNIPRLQPIKRHIQGCVQGMDIANVAAPANYFELTRWI